MSSYEFWDELGRIFNAVVAYQEKSIEFNKRFINPWIRLGNVFDKQDRHREAVEAYQKAIEIDPDNAQVWCDLGSAYFQTKAYDRAIDAFKKAIELDPRLGWPYSNLALTYVTQDNHEQAVSLYQKSIELLADEKDRAVSWNRLGNLYRKLNEYDLALAAFRMADQLDHENTGFRDALDEAANSAPQPEDGGPVQQIDEAIANPIQLIVQDSQADEAALAAALEQGLPGEMVEEIPSDAQETEAIAAVQAAEGVSLPEQVAAAPVVESDQPTETAADNASESVGVLQVAEEVSLPEELTAAPVVESDQPAEPTVDDSSEPVAALQVAEEVSLPEELAAAPVVESDQPAETAVDAASETVTAPAGEEDLSGEAEDFSSEASEDIAAPAALILEVASSPGTGEVQAEDATAEVRALEAVSSPETAGAQAEDVTAEVPAVVAPEPAVSPAAAEPASEPVSPAEEIPAASQPEPALESTPAETAQDTPAPEEPAAVSVAADMDARPVDAPDVPAASEEVLLQPQQAAFPDLSDAAQATVEEPVAEPSLEQAGVEAAPEETHIVEPPPEQPGTPAVEDDPVTVAQESAEQPGEVQEAAEMVAVDPATPAEQDQATAADAGEAGPLAQQAAYDEFLKDDSESLSVLAAAPEAETVEPEAVPATAEPVTRIDSAGDLRIEMDTKNAHVWNELGNVYFSKGAVDDSIIAYSKAIELDRWFAWPYSNLALAYVQKNRFADAILLYQRSIELFTAEKDKAISWNRLGNVYRRMADYENAIAAYQRADELDPDNTTLSLQSRFSLLGSHQLEQTPAYTA
ncbi:MAG: tetratricopeptide repeat protein [Bacteroidota bacterium]